MPQLPSNPVQVFAPGQIIRRVSEQADEAVANVHQRIAKISESFDDQCHEAYEQFKVMINMSPALSKLATKSRNDPETSAKLDKQIKQLEEGHFEAGRGPKKLEGTKIVFYMQSGGRARLFYRIVASDERRTHFKVIAQSNKNLEDQVIKNIKENYS